MPSVAVTSTDVRSSNGPSNSKSLPQARVCSSLSLPVRDMLSDITQGSPRTFTMAGATRQPTRRSWCGCLRLTSVLVAYRRLLGRG
jgi:hypothetical protein